MVTIGMNYDVRVGKEVVFEKAFQRIRGAMNKMEGHDDSRLYRNVGQDSSEYLILSRWRNERAFRSFISSDQFKKVTTWGSAEILRGPPRHTTYTEG